MMHRLILGIYDKSIHVDHVNGNGLYNRKENIRLVTRNQNIRNLEVYGAVGQDKFERSALKASQAAEAALPDL
jgi:hypothetical protein